MRKTIQNFIALETKKTKLTRRLTLIFITPTVFVIGFVLGVFWMIYEESRDALVEFFKEFFKELGPMLKCLYKEFW